jgi:hypothetical protein
VRVIADKSERDLKEKLANRKGRKRKIEVERSWEMKVR